MTSLFSRLLSKRLSRKVRLKRVEMENMKERGEKAEAEIDGFLECIPEASDVLSGRGRA